MKKIFVTAMLLVLINPICHADIQKCQFGDGKIQYYSENEKLPENCVTTSVIVTPTESERQAMIREDERQARQEYRQKVKATAKFLDDVDAARKK